MPRPRLLLVLAVLFVGLGPLAPSAAAQLLFDPSPGWDFDFDFFPTQSAAGDLDADGRLDLVVVGRNVEGLVAVFPGVDGSAVFGPPSYFEVGEFLNAVRLHDLDGDGVLDFIAGSRTPPGGLVIMTGAGDGTFVSRRDFGEAREISDLLIEDVDGDGDPDIVATGFGTDDVRVYRNDGAGGFGLAARTPLALGSRTAARPLWITAGSLDPGGARQFVVGHAGAAVVGVMDAAGGPNGATGPVRRLPLGTTSRPELADMDGDGDDDLVTGVWASPSGTMDVFENDGAGGLDRRSFFSVGFYLWNTATADFNGDGMPDVALSEALSGLVFLYENETVPGGEIELGFPIAAGSGNFPWSLNPVDIDDDCDIDLIICDIASHQIRWWTNLTPQPGCAATDLDGDGHPGVGDVLRVLEGWGDGGGAADVDRDGRVGPLDLLRVLVATEAAP